MLSRLFLLGMRDIVSSLLYSFTKKCKHFFASFATPNPRSVLLSKTRELVSKTSYQNKITTTRAIILFWLGMRDSNPRWRDQNPLPYHLANPQ
jgi:hypothetical protein